jgi:hypothetical protein
MLQQPVHLKTPHSDLVLVSFLDHSKNNPLVTYRLWRKPEYTAGGGPTILEFLAPSDTEAEQFVEAWLNMTRFPISPYRYAWYQKVVDWVAQLEKRWHTLPGMSSPEEMDRAPEEYMAADQFERLMTSAFTGRWPRDPNRDSLS